MTVEAGEQAILAGQHVECGGSYGQKPEELCFCGVVGRRVGQASRGVARGERCVALNPFEILPEISKHLKDKLEP